MGDNDVVRAIGSRREIFVDRWLIDSTRGAHLRLHRPQPRGPVLHYDRPWEGGNTHFITMMQVGDEFRSYYKSERTDREHVAAVAVSKDGVAWDAPTLASTSGTARATTTSC